MFSFPPVDSIWAVIWRIRGKIIGAVLCCAVYFSPNIMKSDCTNILSFKDTFHVSAVLLENAFKMTTPFTAGCETVRHALLNIMMQVSNMQITCCYLSVPWTASVVPSLDTLIHYCCPFIQQPARLVLLNISY